MLPDPIWHPSPNFGARRGCDAPHLIVLHYTAMGSAEAALDRLCDPQFEVSAHWLIGRDGRLWQMVAEDQRAWHAGQGSWAGVTDVNSHSIGIEIDNDGQSPFAEPAMAVLEALLPQVMERWAIPAAGVIGHSDLAPDRKTDPGPRFDWQRLARRGLAVWPEALDGSEPAGDLRDVLTKIGYPADLPLSTILPVFRHRFQSGASCPPGDADLLVALGVLQALNRQ